MMTLVFVVGMVIGGLVGLLLSAVCTMSAIEDLQTEIRRDRRERGR